MTIDELLVIIRDEVKQFAGYFNTFCQKLNMGLSDWTLDKSSDRTILDKYFAYCEKPKLKTVKRLAPFTDLSHVLD